MNVLVLGGTGFIGQHLCGELHERGHDVTALSRSPGDADLPDGVETVAGDVTAYNSIEDAFAGQDAVVNLVALSSLFQTPRGTSHEEVHLGGTKNAVDAAEEHGVDRIVQMSGIGADPNSPNSYLSAKGRAEQVVRDSALDWVIVRPSVVFGDGAELVPFTKLVTTPYVTALPGGGKTRFQLIWVGDLAPMLADCVTDDERAGEVYEIGGPEVVTLADVTRLVYRSEGKPVRIVPVPMALTTLGLTVAGPIPFIPMGRDQARGLKMNHTVVDNDATAFGVDLDDLTTFEEYLGLS